MNIKDEHELNMGLVFYMSSGILEIKTKDALC